METENEQAVIIFDAECVLCSVNAQFVLKHDYDRRFLLAAMQEEYGKELYTRHGIDPANPETLIVETNTGILRDSDAVLYIYAKLGWPWRVANILKIVPKFLRDPVYRFIARNRYTLFGKRDTCWLPKPEYQDRLL